MDVRRSQNWGRDSLWHQMRSMIFYAENHREKSVCWVLRELKKESASAGVMSSFSEHGKMGSWLSGNWD